MEGKLGFITNEAGKIIKIHPGASAFTLLMLGDEILEIEGEKYSPSFKSAKAEITLKLVRYGRELQVNLPINDNHFYTNHKLTLKASNQKREKWML